MHYFYVILIEYYPVEVKERNVYENFAYYYEYGKVITVNIIPGGYHQKIHHVVNNIEYKRYGDNHNPQNILDNKCWIDE